VTADAPATLVWIAPQPPDAAQERALSSWALARGVRLVGPRDDRPAAIPLDGQVADEIEDMLGRAREAIVARDAEAADRALAAAESRLRAHAELPQAAWLMAEVERARSTRWRRIGPVDGEAAERAWMRAEALDGGRAPGIGEQSAGSHPLAASISVVLPGGDLAWLDGRPVRGTNIATSAGPHAIAVTADGVPIWATWVDVPGGSSSIEADAPEVSPCSFGDTARASPLAAASTAARSVDARRVRCAHWVAATVGPVPGAVRIATCEAGTCGPLLDWHVPILPAFSSPSLFSREPTSGAERRRGWPAWATWALAGAGAAVAATVVVVAAGALRSAPTETLFVNGGLKKQ
jgi:hypothetical protein